MTEPMEPMDPKEPQQAPQQPLEPYQQPQQQDQQQYQQQYQQQQQYQYQQPYPIPPELPRKKRLRERSWFIILLLIIFWPVGLYLMWKYAEWAKVAKIIITVVVVGLFLYGMFGGSDTNKSTTDQIAVEEETDAIPEDVAEEETTEATTEAPDPTADYTMEEKNCYKSALNYLDYAGFSKAGLIDQLSSEYGEGYPRETAEKVVNDIEDEGLVDWDAEAEESAKNYLDNMAFSKQELINQLSSDYGEKFTQEQAEKAVNKVYQ